MAKNQDKKKKKATEAEIPPVVGGLLIPADDMGWDFVTLLDDAGRDRVTDYIKKYGTKAITNFIAALTFLTNAPKIGWLRPHGSSIGHNIYMIRFKDGNRTQHRIWGHFDDKNNRFVMTLPGQEKDDEYDPENAGELALGHLKTAEHCAASRFRPCIFFKSKRTGRTFNAIGMAGKGIP